MTAAQESLSRAARRGGSRKKRPRQASIVFLDAEVTGSRDRSATVRFFVDSGAQFTSLPGRVWRSIGLTPRGECTLYLEDGTRITRPASECRLRVHGHEGTVPVLLGQHGDEAVLGAETLKGLGLFFHRFRRTLRPLRRRGRRKRI
ncbi:MAG: aspartyl protease [Planctomycetes bacterium]|nr:aspartyl protease [Planctomycetota bacterium]